MIYETLLVRVKQQVKVIAPWEPLTVAKGGVHGAEARCRTSSRAGLSLSVVRRHWFTSEIPSYTAVMPRFFNNAGPTVPADHYAIDP
ncbi:MULTISPECIES: hypothetical protein, partial [unclassified Ectothiorhodospira]|uniref:hypothetical protein n=1 Tax=unclassified Ectothiorhodospira TaxID=2684909 RepID=UPI001EE994C6